MIVKIKANTLKGLLIHAMIAMGLLFILALGIFQIILPVLTNKGETVTVPDLKGMSIDEVNKFTSTKIWRLKFLIQPTTRDFHHRRFWNNTLNPIQG